jgi:hypothetical protein
LGIEHPVLGLMTFALMAAFVVGAVVYLVLVGMEVQELVLSAPVVDGYAGCFSAGSDGRTASVTPTGSTTTPSWWL